MIDVVFFVVTGLFFAKILWNLGVPYALAAQAFRANREDNERGISLMPIVDVALLVLLLILSFLRDAPRPWNPGGVALFGTILFVGSYIHLLVVGGAAGWLVRKFRDKRNS